LFAIFTPKRSNLQQLMGLSGGKKEQERGPQKKEKKTEPAQGGDDGKAQGFGQITCR